MWRGPDNGTFPSGVFNKFETAAGFAPFVANTSASCSFVDLDMLPSALVQPSIPLSCF